MLLSLNRFSRIVYNSLELMQTQTQPPNLLPSFKILWLWAMMEAKDEKKFTFWIGPSQMIIGPVLPPEFMLVLVVHAAVPGCDEA